MFVVTITYTVPLERIDELVVEHRAWLDDRFAAGELLASGPQTPRVGGVLLAPTGDRAELEKMLAGDPFQRADVSTYTVVAFTPTKTAAELAHLRE
jgi:uncharacterized protein YciI